MNESDFFEFSNQSALVISLRDDFVGHLSGSGLLKKKGFKGSFVEAGSLAKVHQRP